MVEIITILAKEGVLALFLGATLFWVGIRFEKLLKSLKDMVTINNILILCLQRELLAHDLTMTGLNIEMNGEVVNNEQAMKTRQKYDELLETLKNIEKHIRDISNA